MEDTIFMKNTIIISSARECFIDVIHDDADPNSWFVRRWKSYFETRKQVSSDRFSNQQQALAFAHSMKREYDLR